MTTDGETPPGREARGLLRRAATAALATVSRDPGGGPFASLVLAATGHDGAPLLLLSDLAVHSRNIAGDDRVSLLASATEGLEDPLTGARVSVQGRARRSEDASLLARYVTRHPSAADYAGFGDFHLYRVEIEAGHLVAGFGRIHDLVPGDILCPAPAALADAEAGILAHMNGDHADAVVLYARALCGGDGEGARLVGVDPEGCDIRAGAAVMRIDFDTPVSDAAGAREALVALADRARAPDHDAASHD